MVAGLAGGKPGLRTLWATKLEVRAGTEVGEVGDGQHAGAKRSGNAEVCRRGKVRGGLRRPLVVVQRSSKGRGDLSGIAGEEDAVAAAGDRVDGEALLFEPGLDGGKVGVGDAKLCGELVGGKPLVIERRRWVLLGGDEVVERGLLVGRAAEDDRDALKLHRGGDGANVVGGFGPRWTGAGERGTAGVIDGRGEARLKSCRLGCRLGDGGEGCAESDSRANRGRANRNGERLQQNFHRNTCHKRP